MLVRGECPYSLCSSQYCLSTCLLISQYLSSLPQLLLIFKCSISFSLSTSPQIFPVLSLLPNSQGVLFLYQPGSLSLPPLPHRAKQSLFVLCMEQNSLVLFHAWTKIAKCLFGSGIEAGKPVPRLGQFLALSI